MRRHKPFPRVWLAWGRGWAAQAYWYPTLSLGISIDFARPLLDLHFLWFTLAFGAEAHITGQEQRHAHSSRGFLRSDDPVAYL